MTEETAEAQLEYQNFKRKSISGAVSYTVRSLFLYGIGLGTSLILGAYLSAEAFGIYGLVTQIIVLLQFFSDVGLGPALIQKKSEPTIEEYRLVFTVQQVLSWLIFAITLLLAWSGLVHSKIGDAGTWVLLSLGLSFPLSSLKIIPAITLERKLDFSKLVIPAVFEQIIYNILLVWLVLSGWGVMAYAYAIAIRAVVGVIVMYKVQSWPVGWHFDSKTFKSIIGVGAKFQLSDFLARIKDQLFYLALGWYLPLHQFGYITWAKSWSQVPYMLTVQNVISITFPAYSRLQHDPNKLRKAIEKTIFFICVSIFPILVGMVVFIGPFTHLIPKYEKWQPALLTFSLFTLSIGWAALSTPLTNTLNAIGKINTTLGLMIMWTVLTWVLTPLAMWQFGFDGVAIAAMAIAFTSVLPIYFVKKIVPVAIWDNTWRQALASLIMGGVGWLGQAYWARSFGWLLGGMIIVGSVYVLSFLAVGWSKLKTELLSLRSL